MKTTNKTGRKAIVRDKRGLFEKGTAPGPGRPRKPPESYTAAVRETLTPDRVAAVLERLIGLAIKAGSVAAAKEVLLRALGAPNDRGLDPAPGDLPTPDLVSRVLSALARDPAGREQMCRALADNPAPAPEKEGT